MRTTILNSYNSVNSIPIISVISRNVGIFYFIANQISNLLTSLQTKVNKTGWYGSSETSTGVEEDTIQPVKNITAFTYKKSICSGPIHQDCSGPDLSGRILENKTGWYGSSETSTGVEEDAIQPVKNITAFTYKKSICSGPIHRTNENNTGWYGSSETSTGVEEDAIQPVLKNKKRGS